MDFKIENDLIKSIDKSFREAREFENKKCPFAVVLNPENGQNLSFNSFTYLSKSGFKSIPIIKHSKIKHDILKIAFTEAELIDIIKQPCSITSK